MAKVIVIDDDPDILLAIGMCLEGAGHQVIEAQNGKEGIERIKQDSPDLIILDVMMETKTEGFELARKLRTPGSDLSIFANIPILMLTSVQSTVPLQDEPDVDDLPVELFVDKPIDPEGLLSKVDWLVQG